MELACPNVQKITKNVWKLLHSPLQEQARHILSRTAGVYVSWFCCWPKKSLLTPSSSDQIRLVQGLVGAEPFWNNNGTLSVEKTFQGISDPFYPPVLSHQWENKIRVELWYSQFPPSTCPTFQSGMGSIYRAHNLTKEKSFFESL